MQQIYEIFIEHFSHNSSCIKFWENTHARPFDPISKQECIPVGCVLAALSACWDTPPGCGP